MKTIYEKTIIIEHIKLEIIHIIYTICKFIFWAATIYFSGIVTMFEEQANKDMESKLICTAVAFLYLFIMGGLAILFSWLSFNSGDQFVIVPEKNPECEYYGEYLSEQLARHKLGIKLSDVPMLGKYKERLEDMRSE